MMRFCSGERPFMSGFSSLDLLDPLSCFSFIFSSCVDRAEDSEGDCEFSGAVGDNFGVWVTRPAGIGTAAAARGKLVSIGEGRTVKEEAVGSVAGCVLLFIIGSAGSLNTKGAVAGPAGWSTGIARLERERVKSLASVKMETLSLSSGAPLIVSRVRTEAAEEAISDAASV